MMKATTALEAKLVWSTTLETLELFVWLPWATTEPNVSPHQPARTVPFLSALSTTETPSTGPTISSPHTPTTAHASMTGMTMSGMN